jgi:hypothetical protein
VTLFILLALALFGLSVCVGWSGARNGPARKLAAGVAGGLFLLGLGSLVVADRAGKGRAASLPFSQPPAPSAVPPSPPPFASDPPAPLYSPDPVHSPRPTSSSEFSVDPSVLFCVVATWAFPAVIGWLGYRRYMNRDWAFWLIIVWLLGSAGVYVMRSRHAELERIFDSGNPAHRR